MFLEKWDNLPKSLRNEKVRPYYQSLHKKGISLFFKRIFDILFSAVLLIIFSPIFLVLAILIKLDSKGPVFYRQERITQYGRVFKIFKFRTMVQDADQLGSAVTVDNDERITKLGKTIRRFRLDEFPQLINVLIGDMSFVGVRPEVQKYVAQYTPEMKATLLIKAGITSPASIHYKDEDKIFAQYRSSKMSVDDIYVKFILPDKMEYNLAYIRHFSLIRDFGICINTVFTIFKQSPAR